ncbi:MAG TPA: hypothetical protein VMU66_07010 [Gaiellales bacterium]|nr:hypothetical protein [Gaiellales bacterium]
MSRGQASVEYAALLLAVLLVGGCLLVRYQTPVRGLAAVVAHAVAAPAGHHAARRRGHRPAPPRPSRSATHRSCLCPSAAD